MSLHIPSNAVKANNLSQNQRGVIKGIASGLTLAATSMAMSAYALHPLGASLAERASLLALCLIPPATALTISIARLAKHRFFTPSDIDGSALTEGSDRARLLQALLQNTLEQVALAVPVYVAWAMLAPARMLGALVATSGLFLLARLLFYKRYRSGAAARSLGFALTFYPTVLLLIGLVPLSLQRVFG
ncbi:MAG: MAPEG family protein [Nevskia sp.]|nr:MAPEG family protein [Nevskia sp.]